MIKRYSNLPFRLLLLLLSIHYYISRVDILLLCPTYVVTVALDGQRGNHTMPPPSPVPAV